MDTNIFTIKKSPAWAKKIRLWSQLRPVSTDIRCVVSVGGVLDLCYADEEALGGGAGAVARFLGRLEREIGSL